LNLLLLLLLLQDRPVEASIEAFLKDDAAAREELVKLGAYAIRPLQKAREKGPEKIDALVFELKKAAAYPIPSRFDADFKGSRSVAGPPKLGPQIIRAFGRNGIPLFLDQLDIARMKSITVAFENVRSSLELVEQVCRQTGLDYGYFHNHIVLGHPERLWPPGPPSTGRELAGADLARAKALVEQLADEEIEMRDAASRDLLKLGAGVLPVLESQLGRMEAEIVSRCRVLVRELRPRPGVFGPAGAVRQRDLDSAGADILKKLQAKRASLSFQDMPLANILLFFKEVTGVEFRVEAADATRKLSILTEDHGVLDHLSLLSQSEDLDFIIRDGKVIIDTREAIEKKLQETR